MSTEIDREIWARHKALKNAGLMLLLSLFSILVHPGYEAGTKDHQLHLPGIVAKLSPNAFQHDFLLSLDITKYTIFDEIVALTMRVLNGDLFLSLFLLAIAARWIIFAGVFDLVRLMTRDEYVGLLTCFCLLSSFLVYGTGTFTFETLLIPRTLAVAFAILFLTFHARKIILLPELFLLLTCLVHPISGIPFAVYYAWARIRHFSLRHRLLAIGAGLFLTAFILTLKYILFPAGEAGFEFFKRVDPTWHSIMMERLRLISVSHWHYGSYFHLLLSLAMLFVAGQQLRAKPLFYGKEIASLMWIAMSLTAIGIIGADLLKISLFYQLQLSRGLILLKYVSRIAFVIAAYDQLSRNPPDRFYRFALVFSLASYVVEERFVWFTVPLVLVFWVQGQYRAQIVHYLAFGVLALITIIKGTMHPSTAQWSMLVKWLVLSGGSWVMSAYYLQRFRVPVLIFAMAILCAVGVRKFDYRPNYVTRSEYQSLLSWIRESTPQSAVFLTEPYADASTPIRLLAQRSIYVTNKDGSCVQFNRAFAMEWQRRMTVTRQVNTVGGLHAEGIDYLVSSQARSEFGSPVYSDNQFFVYRLAS